MTKTTQYKNTSIGPIPIDWEVKKLGELVQITSGNSPSDFNLFELGKYPYLKVEDLNNSFKYQISSREYTDDIFKNIVKENSLIFPKRGAAIINNKIRISKVDCYLDSNLMALKISDKDVLDLEYLYYKVLDIKLFKIADTSSIPQLNNKHITPFKFPLPPLPEQQKIAEVLSTWDKAIQETDAIVKKLEDRNKALANRLFEENNWQIKKLSDLFERITDKNKEGNTTVTTISARHGFIRQEDFFNKTVASKDLSNYYLINKGDFCYNKSYSKDYDWGVVKRLNNFEKAVVTTLYICFRFKDDSQNSDFWELYFENKILDKGLSKVAQEGGRAHGLLNVTSGDFFGIKVKVPSLEEQNEIADILNTANQEVKQYQQKLETLKLQKKGLMQQLLTGKVRTA